MKSEVFKLYEDRDDVTLTTYILDDTPDMPGVIYRPAILICPGGAYLGCSDREGEPVAMKFVSMGYHAFVLRYSTYMEGKNGFPDMSKPLPVKESCMHPAPMRDVGKSMMIIHEHAAEWMLDEKRIAVCGFSAGAHNAAMYAANWQTDAICGYFGGDREKFRPAAAILGYTLSDYVYLQKCSAQEQSFAKVMFDASNTAFLGTSNPTEEQLVEASPARNVTENMPPAFLWATAKDNVVPVQHSLIMAQALADAKIPFELHVFEEGFHGLSLADQSSALAQTQLNPDAAKWADLAGAWLRKRFAVQLPEKDPFAPQ